MVHYMKLQDKPFQSIKNKKKTIEMRLYDEKRKLLSIGDIIEFTNIINGDKIQVKVINLHLFNSFKDLYDNFDKKYLGYEDDEVANSLDSDFIANILNVIVGSVIIIFGIRYLIRE